MSFIFEPIGHAITSFDNNNTPVFFCPTGWQQSHKAAKDEILITATPDVDAVAELHERPDDEVDKRARTCSIAALGMPVEKYTNHLAELLGYISGESDEWRSLKSFLRQGNNPRHHILYHVSVLCGTLDESFWEYVQEHAVPEYIEEISAEIDKISSGQFD